MNGSIDRKFGANPEIIAANERIVRDGKAEYSTGHFSDGTKDREHVERIRGILRKPRPGEEKPEQNDPRGLRVVNK